jgi:hypothetical protein
LTNVFAYGNLRPIRKNVGKCSTFAIIFTIENQYDMLESIGKLFTPVFRERTTSPLYGTFLIAWCVCNWRIIYLTLFVDDKITGDKLALIEEKYLTWPTLIVYPIISTCVLLWIVPFIANAAYSTSLYFSASRRKKLEAMEKNRMLSVEESNIIRAENYDIKEKHSKQLMLKADEINALNTVRVSLEAQLETTKHELQQLKALDDLRTLQKNNTFQILAAVYGDVLSQKYADVSSALNKAIQNNQLEVLVDNDFFGFDPAPGRTKQLSVIYKNIKGTLQSLTAQEHQTVLINGNGNHVEIGT